MNRDSNSYTFLFTVVMVFLVATSLATTASLLKDLQKENVRKEKMQNILSSIGITTDRENSEKLYNSYITNALSLKSDGTIDKEVDAFKIKLNKELKKTPNQQRFPIYIANVENKNYTQISTLSENDNKKKKVKNLKSSLSLFKGYLPTYFSSEWSFIQYKIDYHKSFVAFDKNDNKLLVITNNGHFYKLNIECENGISSCKQEEYFVFI